MIVVFQTETGGSIDFTIPSTVSPYSGYLDVVGMHRLVYRFNGTVASGNLYVTKSGLSNLSPGNYTLLPQILDATGLIYFLDIDDLQIIDIP